MDRKEVVDWISTIIVILGLVLTFLQALMQTLSPDVVAPVSVAAVLKCLSARSK